MKLYVGNLPYTIEEDDLKELFSSYSSLQSAKVIIDRETGRSKGFGFVEFSVDEEAKAAIEEFNEKEVDGRALKVNEALPQREKSDRYSFSRSY